MDHQQLIKRVEELRQQCRFGKLAWQGLRASLNGMDNEKAFFYIHALLDRARMASRFIWAESEDGAEACEQLRKELKLNDDSALHAPELATFADASEVQFDQWLTGLDHLHYVGMNVMAQGTMAEFRQDAFLRSFDPEIYQFSWYDRMIDVRKIANGLRDVESVAESWLKRQ